MFAKVIGAVTATIVFFLYFRWRGTDPVLETMIGILLSLLVGFWAFWATERRQRRMQQERLEHRDGESGP